MSGSCCIYCHKNNIPVFGSGLAGTGICLECIQKGEKLLLDYYADRFEIPVKQRAVNKRQRKKLESFEELFHKEGKSHEP